jgi:hypothetical protein
MRGGCSCAGTYGHFLLDVDYDMSKEITDKIDSGDLSLKPGWIRLSLHPTMTDEELCFIASSIEETIKNANQWKKDYSYSNKTNEFYHRGFQETYEKYDKIWFRLHLDPAVYNLSEQNKN